jgi:hypothetical protein
MNFSFQAVVAEWQTRCLQAAVIFGRAGSSPANRTIFTHGREINRNSETMEYGCVSPTSGGRFYITEGFSRSESSK